MFCPKCGKEARESSAFCIYCGHSFSSDLSVKSQKGDCLLEMAGKTYFFVIALMLSISFALSFITGSINIALGLSALSLWLLFGSAKKENESLSGAAIKIAAITAKVQYILLYVMSGLLALAGIVSLIIFITEGDTFAVLGDAFAENSSSMLVSLGQSSYDLSACVGSDEGILIGIALMIALFIIAIAVIIMNLIFQKYFLCYFSSIDKGIREGSPVKLYDNGLSKRLIAFGVMGAIGFVAGLVSAVTDPSFTTVVAVMSSGVLTPAYFLAASFVSEKNK